MRIISGKLGGLKIHPPTKMPYTRPTTDIAKEGLFNILQNRVNLDNAKTLDLFAGTGSISYEFYSRGATNLTIIEKDPQMFQFIQTTIKKLDLENANVYKQDIFQYIKNTKDSFDIIFAGPPYSLANIDDIPIYIFKYNLLELNGYFILEHTPRNKYKDFKYFEFSRNYGTTLFSFFKNIKND